MPRNILAPSKRVIQKDASVVALDIEKLSKFSGIKSAAYFDLLRDRAENAYQGILHSATTNADDIVRAEQAKNDNTSALNQQQFGEQTSLLSTLKSNWIAASSQPSTPP